MVDSAYTLSQNSVGGLNTSLTEKANTDFSNLSANASAMLFKPGMVIPYAGTSAPSGWLLCDGSAISRTTYSALFSAIGTTYGVGDGSSTFNLPNFQGRYLKQGTVGTYGAESLPNITGSFNLVLPIGPTEGVALGATAYTGAFSATRTGTTRYVSTSTSTTTSYGKEPSIDASRSSLTYQENAKVNPDNAEILYVIKF